MVNLQTIHEETRRLSVLFVEDDPSLRMRTVEMLADYFYRVDSAEDGVEALEKFHTFYETRHTHYDLVISDIRMPRMDGIELSEALYALREDQPIIILSAHTESEYLLDLINLGIAQFITKPIQYPKMLDSLYKVCKKINTASLPAEAHSPLILLGALSVWDSEKKILTTAGEEIALTKYEIHLMTFLASKIDQICTTEEILSHFFFHNIDVNPDNLRGMMMRLRRKLPPKSLLSVYGLGYRLCHTS